MKSIFIIKIIILNLLFIIKVKAQTPVIKWWYNTNDASFGQSAAKDIDGDNKLEVVFGCYRNDSSIYALNAEDGSLLWKYNASAIGSHGCNDVAPVIYDVDNDGLQDVIVPGSCNPKTFCFNGSNGSLKWTCNTKGSDSPPTIADIDNDGKPEIIHGEFLGYVICINAENGTQAWEILVDANSWVQTAPTIVDLNNDGQLDFVVATWNFNNKDSIFAFSGNNQTRLWAYPVHSHIYHGTAVADFDSDGKPELLIGAYNDTLYCINGENGTTNWKYKGVGYVGSPVTLGDIDNDGSCDVIITNGNKVTALTNTGVVKWSYSIPNNSGSFRGVVLSDVNNDANLDVVFCADKGQVIGLNGINGSLLWSVDLAAHYGNSLFELVNAPLIADFDNDGKLDVFVVGGHAEYPNFYLDFGRAYMITIGAGTGPDWLMFQRDVRRQSSLCTALTTNAITALNEIDASVTIYPNPSSTSATISFTNKDNIDHDLFIYNSIGEIVYKKNKVDGNKLELDLSEWGNGIYFYQLQSKNGITKQSKLLINK